MHNLHHQSAKRVGMTLLELIVVLAILGITAAVAGLTMQSVDHRAPVSTAEATIAHARDSALAFGVPITVMVPVGTAFTPNSPSTVAATAFPDGRVISALPSIDRLTGKVVHAAP